MATRHARRGMRRLRWGESVKQVCGALVLSAVLAGCGGPAQPSTTRVTAPTQVSSFQAVSPSVVEVIFEVRNPRAAKMESVTCIVNAYVSTQNVARFFSGGSIENLTPNESRRVRTSAEIKDSQATFVQRVEVYCSSQMPVG